MRASATASRHRRRSLALGVLLGVIALSLTLAGPASAFEAGGTVYGPKYANGGYAPGTYTFSAYIKPGTGPYTEPLTYEWFFDSPYPPKNGQNVQQTFSQAGTYGGLVKATDANGNFDYWDFRFVIGNPPESPALLEIVSSGQLGPRSVFGVRTSKPNALVEWLDFPNALALALPARCPSGMTGLRCFRIPAASSEQIKLSARAWIGDREQADYTSRMVGYTGPQVGDVKNRIASKRLSRKRCAVTATTTGVPAVKWRRRGQVVVQYRLRGSRKWNLLTSRTRTRSGKFAYQPPVTMGSVTTTLSPRKGRLRSLIKRRTTFRVVVPRVPITSDGETVVKPRRSTVKRFNPARCRVR